MLKLIEPSMEYDQQIQAYRQDFLDSNNSMDGSGSLRHCQTTEEWLDSIEQYCHEETVPEGKVTSSQYIALREEDDKMVGVIQIRHYLNDYLEKYGGHIGYSVAPSERRKGYAKEMLRLALDRCRQMGMDRVLITCHTTNEASRRTILANGGKYDSTVQEPESDRCLERYWIDLTQ